MALTLPELWERYPHLASPAHLGVADRGAKFQVPRHLKHLNKELIDVGLGHGERLMVNMPFQHAKTTMGELFAAWKLMNFPNTRIAMGSYSEGFSRRSGGRVRDLVERWGKGLGYELRRDTRAKGEWNIVGYDGGMVCKGMHGGLTGRPADALLLDDVIKNAEQATSEAWVSRTIDDYQTVAYSRLGPDAPIIILNTRWGVNDLCGWIQREAASTPEAVRECWKVVKFKAIATEGDVLGRTPGEPLWPERVPLKRLLFIREKRGRWFNCAWQQEPEDEEGALFKPRRWPTYDDLGDAYSVRCEGLARRIFLKNQCPILTAGDWAYSTRQTADYTVLGTFAITPAGHMLVLDVVKARFRLEELARELANVCRAHRPQAVVIEQGHPSLARDVLEYPEIPEVRWIPTRGRDKRLRALPAVILAEGTPGKICLPAAPHPWREQFVSDLAAFTGLEDGTPDDAADMLAHAASVVQYLRAPPPRDEDWPEILVPGKTPW